MKDHIEEAKEALSLLNDFYADEKTSEISLTEKADVNDLEDLRTHASEVINNVKEETKTLIETSKIKLHNYYAIYLQDVKNFLCDAGSPYLLIIHRELKTIEKVDGKVISSRLTYENIARACFGVPMRADKAVGRIPFELRKKVKVVVFGKLELKQF